MLDSILLNLKIISKISKNGRITRKGDGTISLESESSFTFLLRSLTGTDRKQALNDINRVLNDAFDKANDIMASKHMDIYELKKTPSESELDIHHDKVEQLRLLITELKNAVKGIENLKETYKSDASTISQLDIFINKIESKTSDMEVKLDKSHYQHIKNETE